MIWNERLNQRRCDLIDKEIECTISDEERAELECLQSLMLKHRVKPDIETVKEALRRVKNQP